MLIPPYCLLRMQAELEHVVKALCMEAGLWDEARAYEPYSPRSSHDSEDEPWEEEGEDGPS